MVNKQGNDMHHLFRKLAFTIISIVALSGCLVMDDLVKEVEKSGSALLAPSVEDTAAAIKLALQNGIESSISTLGKSDGFYGNERVRIRMPDDLAKVDELLRTVGQDKYADRFVKTLNGAAEKAIPEARQVFISVLKQMSIQDAISIMKGDANSATQYFRTKTSNALRQRFRPIVNRATSSVGLTRSYKDLTQRLSLLGVRPKVDDLDGYVTEKALDGLFVYVAEKESEIRADPLGQSANLIRQVFGYYKK